MATNCDAKPTNVIEPDNPGHSMMRGEFFGCCDDGGFGDDAGELEEQESRSEAPSFQKATETNDPTLHTCHSVLPAVRIGAVWATSGSSTFVADTGPIVITPTAAPCALSLVVKVPGSVGVTKEREVMMVLQKRKYRRMILSLHSCFVCRSACS